MVAARKILRYLLGALLLIFLAAILIIQVPSFQTRLTRKVIESLEKNIDGRIELESVHFNFFNTLLVKGVCITDSHPQPEDNSDTLISIGTLEVRFSPLSIISRKGIYLRSVKLRDAGMNLFINKDDYHPNNLSRIFRIPPPDTLKTMTHKSLLRVGVVEAENMYFRMRNHSIPSKARHPWNVDWTDLHVQRFDFRATDFRIADAHFRGTMNEMRIKEKSGWDIQEFSCRFDVGEGNVKIQDARIRDSFGTDIKVSYKMLGRSYYYQDYINRVLMDVDLDNSRVSMSTLARVIPVMYPDSTVFATAGGRAYGTVSGIHATSLSVGFENLWLKAVVDGSLRGLPDVPNLKADIRVSDIRFSTHDLTRVLRSIVPGQTFNLDELGKKLSYAGEITLRGPINKLDTRISINQYGGNEGHGNVNVNLQVGGMLAERPSGVTVNGKLNSRMFDLGPFLGKSAADNISFSADLHLRLPDGNDPLKAELDSIKIDNVLFNGHSYNGIWGKALLDGTDLSARLHASDSALKADVSVWTEQQEYCALVTINAADLHRMNFDKRKVSAARAKVSARMNKDLKHIQGDAVISDVRLYNEAGAASLSDIFVEAELEGSDYNISLVAGDTDGGFYGTSKQFNAYLNIGETYGLTNFIRPGFYIEKGTALSARIDSTNTLWGTIESGRIALNENYIKKLSGNISGPLDSLEAQITAGDIAAAGFHFRNSCIDAGLCGGLLSLNYEYSDTSGGKRFEGNLNGSALLKGKEGIDIAVNPSYFTMDKRKWEIDSSAVHIRQKDIIFDDLALKCDDQKISLSGGMRAEERDTLSARLENMDLSVLNIFTDDKNFDIHGLLNARGRIISPRVKEDLLAGLPGIELDLKADSLRLKGHNYGNLSATCEYEHANKRFKADIGERIDGRNALSGLLYYTPESKKVSVEARMDRFPFGFLGAFTETIFSGLDGFLTADVTMTGQKGQFDMSCKEARIDEGMLEIAFTHVPYFIDGTFGIDNSGIHIRDMKVRDRGKGSGTAVGGVSWNNFKDMKMGLSLDVENIEALNIPSDTEQAAFYGNVLASGKVGLEGPFKNLMLTADARTTGPSSMHFVISDNMDASKGEKLTFIDPYIAEIDPYLQLIEKKTSQQAAQSGMGIKLHVTADNNFKANLDMNGTGFAAGAAGVGKGMIDLDVDTRTKSYSILGDYRLEEGTFDFNASNIVHRQFSIKDGSMIKFNGEMSKTELNVDAVYNTKTSIAPLIADTSSVSNRRLVECTIGIKNKLTDPDIKFGINIPDLDPSVQASVESALNSEGKVQRQFLSVLISNSFLPDEQSGIVNNNSLLSSNVSELMANQINTIFAKLEIPVDLGLNYQPTDNGANLFDVAVSTQLWNNRVVIGGSLGNRQSTNSTGTTIFGDFDIEYKVTKNGALRVKAFSHAADQYSNNLDQSQRNGIGATWQQEYDNFITWWKTLFLKKDAKLKFQEENLKEAKKTKRITLDE